MNQRILNLIKILEERTKNNNAVWSGTSSNNEFKLDFEKATITVDMWYNDDLIVYDFVILNDNGDTVERIVASESEKFSLEYQTLSRLYEVVRKNFFKIDETIDSIFIELQSQNKIGKSHK